MDLHKLYRHLRTNVPDKVIEELAVVKYTPVTPLFEKDTEEEIALKRANKYTQDEINRQEAQKGKREGGIAPVEVDMNFKTTGSTSLQGFFPPDTTYAGLVYVFGEPNGVGDGYKIDVIWQGEIYFDSRVQPFVIYNYKTGKNYLGTDGQDVKDILDWHIGGKVKDVVQPLIDYFNNKLNENCVKKPRISQEDVHEKKKLKEQEGKEIVLGEFSDEQVAKEIAQEKKGQVFQDPQTKKWKVVVKEQIEATIKTGEEEIKISSVEDGVKVVTKDSEGRETSVKIPKTEEPVTAPENILNGGDTESIINKEDVPVVEENPLIPESKLNEKDNIYAMKFIGILRRKGKSNTEIKEYLKMLGIYSDEEMDDLLKLDELKVEEVISEIKELPIDEAIKMLKAHLTKGKIEEINRKEGRNAVYEEDVIDGKSVYYTILKSQIYKFASKDAAIATFDALENLKVVKAATNEELQKEEIGGVLDELTLEEAKQKTAPVNEKTELVTADFKDFDGFVGRLFDVLPKFGLKVYPDPMSEGSDQVGIVISDKEMTTTELRKKFGFGSTMEEKKKTVPVEEFLKKVEEKKIEESSDDITVGYVEALQKALKDVLGAEVKLSKIIAQAKSLDRVALEALKTAMVTRDAEMLKHFLNTLLESK